jgi:NTE family protein
LEPRWPTFGIKLGAAPGTIRDVHDTVSMSKAMLKTMTGFHDRMHIDDAAITARTIVVDTGTVRATDFNLDQDTQDMLFQKGREAALKFLDGAAGQPAWDWEAYKRTHRTTDRLHQRPVRAVVTELAGGR